MDRLGETSTRRTRAQEICDQHAGLVARLVRCQTVVNRLGHSAPRDTAQEPTQERTQMGEDRLGETSARRTRPLETRDEHAALVAQLERHQGPGRWITLHTARLRTPLCNGSTAAETKSRLRVSREV